MPIKGVEKKINRKKAFTDTHIDRVAAEGTISGFQTITKNWPSILSLFLWLFNNKHNTR